MRQRLHLPIKLDGNVWRYSTPADANRRHSHAELELNLVTRGSGTYLLGSRRYHIRRGDLLWLTPGQEHVLFQQTTDFQMWIAVFRRRLVKRMAMDSPSRSLLQFSPSTETCRRLTQHNLLRLEDLLKDLIAEPDEPCLMNTGLGYALLRAWRCFQSAAEVPVRDLHPAVERTARLIQEEPAGASLQAVAHRAGLSTARLSRLFKEQTGSSMVDFRNRQRLERFLEIYGTGQRQTMLAAALEAGFGSYPQFHRVFKRAMGCGPGRYRQQVRS